MKRTLLKKVGIGLSSLCFIAIVGAGCATEDQVRAQREAAEAAAKKAEAAAARAEAASAKCEKTFEKGIQK